MPKQKTNLTAALDQLLGSANIKTNKVDEFALAGLNQQFAAKDEMLSTLQNYGDGQKAQINQDYQDQQNALMGQLARNGLGISSMQYSGGMGLERNRQLTLGNLNDQLLGKKLDVLGGFNNGLQALLGNASNAGLQRDQFEYQKKQDKLNQVLGWHAQMQTPEQKALAAMVQHSKLVKSPMGMPQSPAETLAIFLHQQAT